MRGFLEEAYSPSHMVLPSLSHWSNLTSSAISATCYNAANHEDLIVIEKIEALPNIRLKRPLMATVQKDGDGYLATIDQFDLYGYDDTEADAVEMLKREIESLYNDFVASNNFGEKMLRKKAELLSFVE